MRPFSQKQPFARSDMLIQGDSVRQIWAHDDPSLEQQRRPLRRYAPSPAAARNETEDELMLRLGEELDYARRLLEATSDDLLNSELARSRHSVSLRSLDTVGQILGHIATIIRSAEPQSTIEHIDMGDLKARLKRSGAL